MNFKLDHTTKTLVQNEFLEALKTNNLMVASVDVVMLGLDVKKKQDQLMKQSHVTAWTIEKFKLLNGVTANTIKNMVKDGRIREDECYKDSSGVLQIMTSAIKRLKHI